MLKQQLQQKLQQKLSPAQIQVIKMLEIPTLELEERIRQELEENPVLEVGAEPEEEDRKNRTTLGKIMRNREMKIRKTMMK